MATLKERLSKTKALFAKRTPGSWVAMPFVIAKATSNHKAINHWKVRPIQVSVLGSIKGDDAELVAHLPEIEMLIKAMEQEKEGLVNALKFYISHSDGGRIARISLTDIGEYEDDGFDAERQIVIANMKEDKTLDTYIAKMVKHMTRNQAVNYKVKNPAIWEKYLKAETSTY